MAMTRKVVDVISPKPGKVWLMQNNKWFVYKGTTSIRKLYYRAHAARIFSEAGFWVHEHGKVQGAWFHKDWVKYTATISMEGVPVEKLPLKFDFRGNGRKVSKPETLSAPYGKPKQVYLAGSLRNPNMVQIHKAIVAKTGCKVFSDWFCAGHEADDHWRDYYKALGYTYEQALKEPASVNVFEFDKRNIDASEVMVLALPAGKSGHLELGYHLGKGKPGYILLDDPERWDVMYQFATGVTSSIEELCKWIKESK